MKLKTDSGCISVDKRSPYGKFVLGYLSSGAFSGGYTLSRAWAFGKRYKSNGMSWHSLGVAVGNMFADHVIDDSQF